MSSSSSDSAASSSSAPKGELVKLTLKWSGSSYTLQMMLNETLEDLKTLIEMETGVRPVNQKIFGLKMKGRVGQLPDDALLQDLSVTQGKVVKMMGSVDSTIEEAMAAEEGVDLVLDDLDWDTVLDVETQLQMKAAREALARTVQLTNVNVMNQPRPDKKLLVLDLDHTLLHFDSKHTSSMEELKRPFMDEFLAACYQYYDLVVWSQTKWHWVEIKLTEMGMITSPSFKICFALDRTCMFKVTREYKGETRTHEVKALEIIWSKFPQWSAKNTVHIDDLSRNFAMNPQSGLQCTKYKRKRSRAKNDRELVELAAYLECIAKHHHDFTKLDHKNWKSNLKNFIDASKKQ